MGLFQTQKSSIMAMWTIPPQRYSFDDDYYEGKTFEVVVSGIFDVSKFWMYKRSGPLNNLTNCMMDFFKIYRDSKIPEYMLYVGLYCVVHSHMERSELYRRARVVDIMPHHPGLTKVFFIDFGDVETVRSGNIHYLPQIFATIPYQVIRGRLAGVFPPEKGMAWSINSTKRFCSLVQDRILLAKVCSIDTENQVLEVELAEFTPPTRSCVNKILIDEGLALCQCQERYENSLNLNTPDDFHTLYPNFWDLEAGSMLPFHEIDFIINFVASNQPKALNYPPSVMIEEPEEPKPTKPRRNISKRYRVSGAFVTQLLCHDESCYNFVAWQS